MLVLLLQILNATGQMSIGALNMKQVKPVSTDCLYDVL